MKWLKKNAGKAQQGTIHSLNLSDNALGVDGIATVCKALTGTSIHTLALDANVKVGIFNSGMTCFPQFRSRIPRVDAGKEAGDALAAFVNSTPSLRELSVSSCSPTSCSQVFC